MSQSELLEKWRRMIVRLQIEHEVGARDFEKFSWKLGIPCVALSAVVSASAFSSIANSELVWPRYLAAGFSILTLVLSSLQTFLNFDSRAAAHQDAAEKLGAMAREIQEELASGKQDGSLGAVVTDLRKRLDAVLADAPTLPKSTIRRLGAGGGVPGDLARQEQDSVSV
ncbi:SLATT domain-containing protein [Pseudomonas japonica]|uniref:SMODS and SLOG-associating 2TM effector domain-containing protein n=1 Tax=Pseudomonas japonica TaxID=256466 RepID=A0A239KIF3_9PSED|nr:SLATT domain-containing protein [Pseudomonas japonica]SNT17855.1 hypothetical protein SAMN05444352_12719 [Pseudomonas japonica]